LLSRRAKYLKRDYDYKVLAFRESSELVDETIVVSEAKPCGFSLAKKILTLRTRTDNNLAKPDLT